MQPAQRPELRSGKIAANLHEFCDEEVCLLGSLPWGVLVLAIQDAIPLHIYPGQQEKTGS